MRSLILTAAALIFTLGACNKSEPSSDTNSFAQSNDVIDTTTSASATTVDEAFVTEAMKGDNGEVEIGQLAQSQGQSQAVKDFGKQLVGDHGAHKEELASLAQTAGITVTDELSDEAKANLEKLKALHGAAFDKQFKAMMVEDHQKDIAKYEQQAKSQDAQTAALAQKTLPVLRKHLDAAKAL